VNRYSTRRPVLLALVPAVLFAGLARGQTFELCSVDAFGIPGLQSSGNVCVDDSGQRVVFLSVASNLAPGLSGGLSRVVLRDRSSGTTSVISLSSSGEPADVACASPSISADGRYVAWDSRATNLDVGHTQGFRDVFVRDLSTGVTVLASADALGVQGNEDSYDAKISRDGQRLLFVSQASNLGPVDLNTTPDVYLKDLATGAVVRVSVGMGGTDPDATCDAPNWSGDGTTAVFVSAASNLVAGDANGATDVFVCDLSTGTISRVSMAATGADANNSSEMGVLSETGRFVAFASRATNLVAGVPNANFNHPYLHDRVTGATVRLDITTTGAFPLQNGWPAGVSPDGAHAWFWSTANNLATGDGNGRSDIFVRDVLAGMNTRLTLGLGGASTNDDSSGARLSWDGRFLAFTSEASNLVVGDWNSAADAYLRTAGPPFLELYWDGDGDGYGASASWTSELVAPPGFVALGGDCDDADPARNPGAVDSCNGVDDDCDGLVDEGCVLFYCTPSTTTNGCTPLMYTGGFASASAATPFHLVAYGVDGLRTGGFFYGLAPAATPWAVGSTSFKCVASPTQRTDLVFSGGNNGQCNGVLLYDLNGFLNSHPGALGAPFPAGAKLYVQAWFRDPPAPRGTNLSDAAEIVLGP
jgi:Tol biopolymer transport system component